VIHPQEKVHYWKKESALERIRNCTSMLYLRGFLSDSERKKVHNRMIKWVRKFEDKQQ
jgi:hypothetical protein